MSGNHSTRISIFGLEQIARSILLLSSRPDQIIGRAPAKPASRRIFQGSISSITKCSSERVGEIRPIGIFLDFSKRCGITLKAALFFHFCPIAEALRSPADNLNGGANPLVPKTAILTGAQALLAGGTALRRLVN